MRTGILGRWHTLLQAAEEVLQQGLVEACLGLHHRDHRGVLSQARHAATDKAELGAAKPRGGPVPVSGGTAS